jgi:hypothetical protein
LRRLFADFHFDRQQANESGEQGVYCLDMSNADRAEG